MNAIVKAIQTAKKIIETALTGQRTPEIVRAELMQLKKEELVDRLMQYMKGEKVTIESVCKPILESKDCAWLTYEEIATLVAKMMNSNTTKKGIADYASKRGWEVAPRKSQKERNELLMEGLK